MLINRTILDAAARYVRDKTEKRREHIRELVRAYETACALSCGGDERRNRYWDGKAGEARQTLCTAIAYCQEAERGVPCRGTETTA